MRRLTDLLALSHVPRWNIVDHSKAQSVADHTFRVMVIATEIAARNEMGIGWEGMLYILHHDADESYSADIPTPAKRKLGLKIDSLALCPWIGDWVGLEFISVKVKAIIDLADQIEAYTFIRRYGTGAHAKRVEVEMTKMVHKMCSDFESSFGSSGLKALIEEIANDYGRGLDV